MNVDPSEALKLKGVNGAKVRGYYDMRDLAGVSKGMRSIGGGFASTHHAEEHHQVFTHGFLLSVGSIVGIIVADTIELAEKAAKEVEIEHTKDDHRIPYPTNEEVFTIDEAIKKESKLKPFREEMLKKLETAYKKSDKQYIDKEANRWGAPRNGNLEETKKALEDVYRIQFTQYYEYDHKIIQGDVEKEFKYVEADGGAVVSGEVNLGYT